MLCWASLGRALNVRVAEFSGGISRCLSLAPQTDMSSPLRVPFSTSHPSPLSYNTAKMGWEDSFALATKMKAERERDKAAKANPTIQPSAPRPSATQPSAPRPSTTQPSNPRPVAASQHRGYPPQPSPVTGHPATDFTDARYTGPSPQQHQGPGYQPFGPTHQQSGPGHHAFAQTQQQQPSALSPSPMTAAGSSSGMHGSRHAPPQTPQPQTFQSTGMGYGHPRPTRSSDDTNTANAARELERARRELATVQAEKAAVEELLRNAEGRTRNLQVVVIRRELAIRRKQDQRGRSEQRRAQTPPGVPDHNSSRGGRRGGDLFTDARYNGNGGGGGGGGGGGEGTG